MEVMLSDLSDPRRLAKLLGEYQKWRRGEGKYKWDFDSAKCAEPPFTPVVLGKIEDAAIGMLKEYGKTYKAPTKKAIRK